MAYKPIIVAHKAITTMQLAGQSQVSYTFDNANRLTGITGANSVAFGYDNANRRTSLTLPNGIIEAYNL
jgi:YD repeat-containing protein